MTDEIKFTEEEMTKLKEIQDGYSKIANESGQLFLERVTLRKRLDEVNAHETRLTEHHDELREKERQLTKELTDKYGTGELNTTTGVFTPRP